MAPSTLAERAKPLLPSAEEISHFFQLEPGASRVRDLDGWPTHQDLNRLLGNEAGIEFGPSPKKGRAKRDEGPSYDDSIVQLGRVPTRLENHHDLMNALVWAVFPRAKRALHRIQRELIAHSTDRSRRSDVHDALAMVDEGGVVLSGDRIILFGHALYEHLATRRGPVFGMGLTIEDGDGSASGVGIDRALADFLEARGRTLRHAELPRVRIDRGGSELLSDRASAAPRPPSPQEGRGR